MHIARGARLSRHDVSGPTCRGGLRRNSEPGLSSLLRSAEDSRPLGLAGAAAVNAAASAGPGWLELDVGDGVSATRVRRFGAPATAAVLSVIAQEAVELLSAGAPIRTCATPGCVLFFIKDHARRTSCSPACSDHARAARHYLRRQHG